MALETVILLELVYKDHSDGTETSVRLTSAPFDVSYDSYTWYAAGDLISIGDQESNYELITDTLDIKVSGVNNSYQAIIDQNGFRNSPVNVFIAQVPDGTNVVSSAKYYHRGFAQTPVTEFDEQTGTITVLFESISAFKNLERNTVLMSTSLAHHQAYHQGDMFFQYVADAGLSEETWKD